MAKLSFDIYLSYSQLCVFLSSLTHPFNDWSNRSFTQGFSWRDGSTSFRTLLESGDHAINLFIEEPIPEIAINVVRAIRVPFETKDGKIEIAGISDSISLDIPSGKYGLQVEFLDINESQLPEINIRLNKGRYGFDILKSDGEISTSGDFDIDALPAV